MGFAADSRPVVSASLHGAFNHGNLNFTCGPSKVENKRKVMGEHNHLALLREVGEARGNSSAPDVVQR